MTRQLLPYVKALLHEAIVGATCLVDAYFEKRLISQVRLGMS